jgi:hypothetical protein
MLCILKHAFGIGFEGRDQFFLGQLLPGIIGEPRMGLQLLNAVDAEALVLLALKQAVDEVHGLHAPPAGQLLLSEAGLFGEYLVSDLFP